MAARSFAIDQVLINLHIAIGDAAPVVLLHKGLHGGAARGIGLFSLRMQPGNPRNGRSTLRKRRTVVRRSCSASLSVVASSRA